MQITQKIPHITGRTTQFEALPARPERYPRQAMPSTEPLTILAVEASGADIVDFKAERGFAA